jgi:hypothetical protein
MIEHCDECGAEIEPDTFDPLMDHYAEEHPETMTAFGGKEEA